MSRRRHTPEQVVRKLRETDRLLGEGTYHRWRVQFGGMRAEDVKRLKELEVENTRLSGWICPGFGGVGDQQRQAA